MVAFVQTRLRAHVVQWRGPGLPWVSICPFRVRRPFTQVQFAATEAAPSLPWCPLCVRQVKAMAAAVLGLEDL